MSKGQKLNIFVFSFLAISNMVEGIKNGFHGLLSLACIFSIIALVLELITCVLAKEQ